MRRGDNQNNSKGGQKIVTTHGRVSRQRQRQNELTRMIHDCSNGCSLTATGVAQLKVAFWIATSVAKAVGLNARLPGTCDEMCLIFVGTYFFQACTSGSLRHGFLIFHTGAKDGMNAKDGYNQPKTRHHEALTLCWRSWRRCNFDVVSSWR